MLKSLPSRLVVLSVGLIVLAMSILTYGIYTVSTAMNERAAIDSIALFESQIHSGEETLKSASRDYNNWDEVYENIADEDLVSFFENYAITVDIGDPFSQLVIINGFSEGVASWVPGTGMVPEYNVVSEDFLEAVTAVTERDLVQPGDKSVAHFYSFIDEELTLHAISYVLPLTDDIRSQAVAESIPVSVMSVQITEEELRSGASDPSLAEGLAITQTTIAHLISAPIFGYEGQPIAYLNWEKPVPGTEIVNSIRPTLLALSVFFIALTGLFTIIARRSAVKLLAQEGESNSVARTDALTALGNRLAFSEELSKLDLSIPNTAALAYIDLNEFKLINDKFGHNVGDEILIAFSQRISSIGGEDTHVMRLGGDEFAMIRGNCENAKESAIQLLSKIVDVLSHPVSVRGHTFNMHAAIGVSVNDRDSIDGQEMLRRADVAMYHAKNTGNSKGQFFDEELERVAKEDEVILRALRHAIKDGTELTTVFQPIVDAKTHSLVKGEALARWTSKSIGEVRPDRFIDIAERYGLIPELSRLLFEDTCQCLARFPSLRVSVNVSPIQLQDDNFLSDFHSITLRHGIIANRIEFELTEGVIVENRTLAGLRLKRMKELGYRTALDDFGTGFSSIGYLLHMPFDTLKIDRSFVLDTTGSDKNLELVRSMIIMGQSLDQEVVCEGIETSVQADVIQSFGCDMLQGFFFDRALQIDAFAAKYLESQTKAVA